MGAGSFCMDANAVRGERHRKPAGYGGWLMGWSLPEVPEKDQVQSWSPWICLLIIVLGLFLGLIIAVLKSPTTGLPALSSGYWLPLTFRTIFGILVAIAAYCFWWESQATLKWNWNEWCRNMRLMWHRRAQQHLVILHHVLLCADSDLLPYREQR
jgi:H+/Cl- antiporter ClcA